MLLGIIGMFGGLALATVAIILLYDLESFSTAQIVAASLTYILATRGYMLLAKGIDLKGTVICSIVTLIMVYFSHEVAVAWHLQRFLGDTVSFSSAYQGIHGFMEIIPDFKKWYYIELVVAYIINIACIIMGPYKVLERR